PSRGIASAPEAVAADRIGHPPSDADSGFEGEESVTPVAVLEHARLTPQTADTRPYSARESFHDEATVRLPALAEPSAPVRPAETGEPLFDQDATERIAASGLRGTSWLWLAAPLVLVAVLVSVLALPSRRTAAVFRVEVQPVKTE